MCLDTTWDWHDYEDYNKTCYGLLHVISACFGMVLNPSGCINNKRLTQITAILCK